jgi:hypothetical protein
MWTHWTALIKTVMSIWTAMVMMQGNTPKRRKISRRSIRMRRKKRERSMRMGMMATNKE